MLLGDFDVEEFQVEGSKVQTDSALIAFSMYMLFGPIVTMNLLIAIMGDSYDFVRENQRLYGLKEKAKALYDIDHTFFTIEYFRKDKYFPKYLHVLTRKDGDSIDDEEEKWEGHLKKLKREIQKNAKEMTEKMENNSTQLKKEMAEMKKEIQENISEKMENNSKELKMEISAELSEMRKEIQENMSDKIENNSKELKEDMKDLESKLDQLLELLSKSQNPD